MKVIGVARKVGTFTDRETKKSYDYDNALLYCVLSEGEAPQGLEQGQAVETIKIKYAEYADTVSSAGGKSIIGKQIKPLYNRYGKVDSILLQG